MGIVKGYPRSKTRDMEMSAVKGPTPRYFEGNMDDNKMGQKKRGTNTVQKMKSAGKIPK